MLYLPGETSLLPYPSPTLRRPIHPLALDISICYPSSHFLFLFILIFHTSIQPSHPLSIYSIVFHHLLSFSLYRLYSSSITHFLLFLIPSPFHVFALSATPHLVFFIFPPAPNHTHFLYYLSHFPCLFTLFFRSCFLLSILIYIHPPHIHSFFPFLHLFPLQTTDLLLRIFINLNCICIYESFFTRPSSMHYLPLLSWLFLSLFSTLLPVSDVCHLAFFIFTRLFFSVLNHIYTCSLFAPHISFPVPSCHTSLSSISVLLSTTSLPIYIQCVTLTFSLAAALSFPLIQFSSAVGREFRLCNSIP